MRRALRISLGAAAVAVAATGCGSSKPITNEKLAADLQHDVGFTSPIVCKSTAGQLGRLTAMHFDRTCGIAANRPSIYVRTGVKPKPGWCVVTPLYANAPKCPLQ